MRRKHLNSVHIDASFRPSAPEAVQDRINHSPDKGNSRILSDPDADLRNLRILYEESICLIESAMAVLPASLYSGLKGERCPVHSAVSAGFRSRRQRLPIKMPRVFFPLPCSCFPPCLQRAAACPQSKLPFPLRPWVIG